MSTSYYEDDRRQTARTKGSGQIAPDPARHNIPEFQFEDRQLQNLADALKAFVDSAHGVGPGQGNTRYVRTDDLMVLGLVRIIRGEMFPGLLLQGLEFRIKAIEDFLDTQHPGWRPAP